jgi:arylsulfatase A-like enzyme
MKPLSLVISVLLFSLLAMAAPPNSILMMGDIYESGTLVPGVTEWPARIPKPRVTGFRASTSDLTPGLPVLDQWQHQSRGPHQGP